MPKFEYRPQPKPEHKRYKPTAKQRGQITPKVRQQLYERSKGWCERCGKRGAHAAHLTRRWKLKETTVNDLTHLCVRCHVWADTNFDGRQWLAKQAERLGRGEDVRLDSSTQKNHKQ